MDVRRLSNPRPQPWGWQLLPRTATPHPIPYSRGPRALDQGLVLRSVSNQAAQQEVSGGQVSEAHPYLHPLSITHVPTWAVMPVDPHWSVSPTVKRAQAGSGHLGCHCLLSPPDGTIESQENRLRAPTDRALWRVVQVFPYISQCNSNMHITYTMNVMPLSHPKTIPLTSTHKLSSMKPVPDFKKVGGPLP